MEKKLTLQEGILDALIDDVSSIVQISEYLKHLGYDIKKESLKSELINLLNENIIMITYPENVEITEFVNADVDGVNRFWFELTEVGITKWNKI